MKRQGKSLTQTTEHLQEKATFCGWLRDFDVVGMAVGFVDGVFLQDYPPTPIEVYHLARKNGVHLASAASLGALRAVELEKFGMVGIGKIFQLYKTGKLNADDEVAVTFASESDYQLQSEAMIDIRYNLYLAHKKGIHQRKGKKSACQTGKRNLLSSPKIYVQSRGSKEQVSYA